MIVVCTILVTYMHFQSYVDATGKVKGSNSSNYLVDFSDYAKDKELDGDYSRVVVSKSKCVPVGTYEK